MDLVTSSSQSPLNLFAHDFPRVTVPVTIKSGAGEVAVGTVLGKVTASGEYAPYDGDANDGTETAKLILKDAVDATSEAVLTNAYVTGVFNANALTGLDAAARVDFEGTPIILKDDVVE
jgi:hypothetical protein